MCAGAYGFRDGCYPFAAAPRPRTRGENIQRGRGGCERRKWRWSRSPDLLLRPRQHPVDFWSFPSRPERNQLRHAAAVGQRRPTWDLSSPVSNRKHFRRLLHQDLSGRGGSARLLRRKNTSKGTLLRSIRSRERSASYREPRHGRVVVQNHPLLGPPIPK